MISHQTLRRMVYFAAIAEVGSIRAAAARLNLSVPVMSEALSELEAELGVSLATRTTRKFELTQAGVRAHEAAQQIVDAAGSLMELASQEQPLSGKLSLTVPVELAGFWLPEKIAAFHALHPDVVFDIDVTDALVDLPAGPVEVAIRTEYVAPNQRIRSTANLPLVVVTRHPMTVSDDGHINTPLIDSRSDRKLLATPGQGENIVLTFTRTHRVTNRVAALALARKGLGAVMVMRGTVEADIQTGALAQLMPDHSFGSIDLRAHFRDRLPSRAATAFVNMLDQNDR